MLEILKSIKVGDKIIVGIKAFNNEIVELSGRYFGDLKQHGYYSYDGSWGLYSIKKYIPDRKEKMCYQFNFKIKGKRNMCSLRIGYDVVNIKIV